MLLNASRVFRRVTIGYVHLVDSSTDDADLLLLSSLENKGYRACAVYGNELVSIIRKVGRCEQD